MAVVAVPQWRDKAILIFRTLGDTQLHIKAAALLIQPIYAGLIMALSMAGTLMLFGIILNDIGLRDLDVRVADYAAHPLFGLSVFSSFLSGVLWYTESGRLLNWKPQLQIPLILIVGTMGTTAAAAGAVSLFTGKYVGSQMIIALTVFISVYVLVYAAVWSAWMVALTWFATRYLKPLFDRKYRVVKYERIWDGDGKPLPTYYCLHDIERDRVLDSDEDDIYTSELRAVVDVGFSLWLNAQYQRLPLVVRRGLYVALAVFAFSANILLFTLIGHFFAMRGSWLGAVVFGLAPVMLVLVLVAGLVKKVRNRESRLVWFFRGQILEYLLSNPGLGLVPHVDSTTRFSTMPVLMYFVPYAHDRGMGGYIETAEKAEQSLGALCDRHVAINIGMKGWEIWVHLQDGDL
jgi:hypothetical protein